MSPTILEHDLPVEYEDVRAGRLPLRYGHRLQDVFLERLTPLLHPGVSILDVGAGRSPTLAPQSRPARCRYVGMDISADELAAAGPLAYDEAIAGDVTMPIALDDPVDVVISWQVLEHVAPIDAAFVNLRRVLVPGGTMLIQLSGSYALFSVLSHLMPHRLKVTIMTRLLGHHEEEKFATRYDRCHPAAFERMLFDWADLEIVPFYRGATYLNMSRPLQRAYLGYENQLERHNFRALATHYLIIAERPRTEAE